jgi:hypothetical protein
MENGKMQDIRVDEKFASYSDYLKKTYPKINSERSLESEFKSAGSRMAHESLQLMRSLLSHGKLSCK